MLLQLSASVTQTRHSTSMEREREREREGPRYDPQATQRFAYAPVSLMQTICVSFRRDIEQLWTWTSGCPYIVASAAIRATDYNRHVTCTMLNARFTCSARSCLVATHPSTNQDLPWSASVYWKTSIVWTLLLNVLNLSKFGCCRHHSTFSSNFMWVRGDLHWPISVYE